MKRAAPLALALSLASALSLAACSNSTASGGSTPVITSGAVRFINASPDGLVVDVAIGTAGHPVFLSVPYAGNTGSNYGFTPYAHYVGPSQNIYVYPSGQDSSPLALNLSSVPIVPGGRTTVVLTGQKQENTLKLVTFAEHIFQTASGAAAVSFHDASTTESGPFNVGYTPASSTSQRTSIGTASPANPAGQPVFLANLPQSVASVGINFYAQGAGSGSSQLNLLPNHVDPSNANNQMPANLNGNPNADQNLSVYVIDGPGPPAGSPTLIGIFDPNG